MTNEELQAFRSALAEVSMKLATLTTAFEAAGGVSLTGSATGVIAPNPLYEMDANQMLTHCRQVGNARVDPVVGADCPNTVVLPETGHVLSVPRPDLGEMFVGYCMRTADQTTGGDGKRVLDTVGALFLGSAHLFAPGVYDPKGTNWPRAADKFANIKAYMTPEERARDEQSKQQWADWEVRVQERVKREREQEQGQQPLPLPDGETPL